MNKWMLEDLKILDAAGVRVDEVDGVCVTWPFGPFGPSVDFDPVTNQVTASFGPQWRVQPYLSTRSAMRVAAKVLRDEIHRRFAAVADELGGTVVPVFDRVTVDLGDAAVFCEIIWRSDRQVDTVDILVRLTDGPTVTVWTSDDCKELPCESGLAGIVHDAVMDIENERN
nr:MAG TPA: hypothetical protein [Caudoviricetes sp.]